MNANATHTELLYSSRTGTSKRLHTAVLEYRGVELVCKYTRTESYGRTDWHPESHIVAVTVGMEEIDISRLVDIDELEQMLDDQLMGVEGV